MILEQTQLCGILTLEISKGLGPIKHAWNPLFVLQDPLQRIILQLALSWATKRFEGCAGRAVSRWELRHPAGVADRSHTP
jgi:hypothetical protein